MRTMLHRTAGPSSSTSSSSHSYTHMGVGGAGNIRRIAPPISLTTPHSQSLTTTSTHTSTGSDSSTASTTRGHRPLATLHQPHGFSTGRGGAGNMSRAGSYLAMFGFEEDVVDQPQRSRSSRSAPATYRTGRGGGGNVVYAGASAVPTAPIVTTVGVRRSVSDESDDSLHSENVEQRAPHSRTPRPDGPDGLDGSSARKRGLEVAREWLRRW